MKKIALAILFVCCTLTLAAQGIRVNYQGEKPTISDFAWAILSYDNGEEEEEGYADESFNAFKQDVTVTYWYENKKEQKTLKWNGSKFGF